MKVIVTVLLTSALALSCRTISKKVPNDSHVKFEPTFEPSSCMVAKANKPEMKVCFIGSVTEEKKMQSLNSLKMWQKAVASKYFQAKAIFVESCDSPDVNVNISQGYATPRTIMSSPPHVEIYTQTEYGNVIHEFGHAYACLGDTYVGVMAGYCQSGQPKSIMCHGMLINEITEDDIAGVRHQYERLGLDKKDLFPKGDDDEDTVLNADDKCPRTPKCVENKDKKPEDGKSMTQKPVDNDCEKPVVWKSKEKENLKWLGCAQGETPIF